MRGYSLTELLVAVGLGSVLLAGASAMMQLSHRAYRSSSSTAESVREATRMASVLDRVIEGADPLEVEDTRVTWRRARERVPVLKIVDERTLVVLVDGAAQTRVVEGHGLTPRVGDALETSEWFSLSEEEGALYLVHCVGERKCLDVEEPARFGAGSKLRATPVQIRFATGEFTVTAVRR